jgi:hypothetical protein
MLSHWILVKVFFQRLNGLNKHERRISSTWAQLKISLLTHEKPMEKLKHQSYNIDLI